MDERAEMLNGFCRRPCLGEAARRSEARVRALRAELQIAASHGRLHGFMKCRSCWYYFIREPWRVFPHAPNMQSLRDPLRQNSGFGIRYRDPDRREGSPGYRMRRWNSRKPVTPRRWYIISEDSD